MRNMEPAHFHQPHMRSRRPPAARCDAETANVVHPWPAHTTYPWAATGGTMRDTLSGERGKTLLPEITGSTLMRAIRHGGMSTLYLRERVYLSRKVAIKVMWHYTIARRVTRGRCPHEARTQGRLDQPITVPPQ